MLHSHGPPAARVTPRVPVVRGLTLTPCEAVDRTCHVQRREFARHGRVSVRMLRHYDAIGLIRPACVDAATGYRFYRRVSWTS